MRYNYIKGSIQVREEWVFNLFDRIVEDTCKSWLEKKTYEAIYDELKMKMIGGYLNDPNHKYHKYIKKLLNMRLIKKELLDYVLVNSVDRSYFEKIFGRMFDGAITLGVAFPWVHPDEVKKSGATAVHQIFIWDIEAWLEKTSKWYYRLFFGKPDFIPLDPEIAMIGLIYHELIHARQYIVDGKREPPRRKDGTINYKNYLEKEAYRYQMELEDKLRGEPYYLDKFRAKTYEEAADKYLDLLTKN